MAEAAEAPEEDQKLLPVESRRLSGPVCASRKAQLQWLLQPWQRSLTLRSPSLHRL